MEKFKDNKSEEAQKVCSQFFEFLAEMPEFSGWFNKLTQEDEDEKNRLIGTYVEKGLAVMKSKLLEKYFNSLSTHDLHEDNAKRPIRRIVEWQPSLQ